MMHDWLKREQEENGRHNAIGTLLAQTLSIWLAQHFGLEQCHEEFEEECPRCQAVYAVTTIMDVIEATTGDDNQPFRRN